jgi:hypothetical protein
MLGDTGANALGAFAGTVAAHRLPIGPALLTVLALLLANLVAERFSLDTALRRAGPLRWIDSIGCGDET